MTLPNPGDVRWAVMCLVWGVGVANLAAAAEVQPNRLDFGRIHTGAVAQGSVRIFGEPAVARLGKAGVTPPGFVKVGRVVEGVQEYGPGNEKGYCDIEVTIDTSRAGKFAGSMVVTLGADRVEVPVAAIIRPRTPDRPRVLVASSPFQKYSTSDAGMFEPWLRLVERADLDVDYLDDRPRESVLAGVDLTEFDGVLLAETALFGLRDEDIAALRRYVEAGGRILVTADAFYVGTVRQANRILVPYGLQMLDSEDHKNPEVLVGLSLIEPCPSTAGVKSLGFFRASPSRVLDPTRATGLVTSPTDADEHFVAMATAGAGTVAVVGKSLWWTWLAKHDNAILLQNLLPGRRRP